MIVLAASAGAKAQPPLDGVEYQTLKAGGRSGLNLPYVTPSRQNNGRQRLLAGLQLLPVTDYDGEVLRYTNGYVEDQRRVMIVVQFAVLRPNAPESREVQIVVVRGVEVRDRYRVTGRWRAYVQVGDYRRLRNASLAAIAPRDAFRAEEALSQAICLDGSGESLEFQSAGPERLAISREGGCEDKDPVEDAGRILIAGAQQVLGPLPSLSPPARLEPSR